MMDIGNDNELPFSLSCLILSTIEDKLERSSRVEGKGNKKWRNVEMPLRLQLFYGVLKSKAEMLLESTTSDSRQDAPRQLHSGIAGRSENSSMQLSSSPGYAEFIY